MQATLEQLENDVKQLSPKELRKVRELVDSLLKEEKAKPKMTEEEFEQYLYDKGLISEVKPPVTDFSRYDDYERITVIGEPISQTIIEERR